MRAVYLYLSLYLLPICTCISLFEERFRMYFFLKSETESDLNNSAQVWLWSVATQRCTRQNHFPSNGVATDPMTVFFGIINAFKYWCSLFSLKSTVLKWTMDVSECYKTEVSLLKRLFKHSFWSNNCSLLLASNWRKHSEIYFESQKEIFTLRRWAKINKKWHVNFRE